MRRYPMLRAARFPLCLATLVAGAAPIAGQGGDQAAAFFDRFGFQEASVVPVGNGRTGTIYRPGSVWSEDVQLELQAAAGGEVVSVELLVSRRLLADDPSAAHDLVAAYLQTAVPFEDEPLVAPLQGMILSDDEAVRRGEEERNRGCCALPPVPGRDVAAVAVVDGRSTYALLRLDESSVRFRNVTAPDGRPALRVTVWGPDGPEQVLDALFDAARLEESAWLVDLCPRGGDIDGDVQTLCELHPEHEAWREFVEAFAAGAVTGPAEIDGDRARVPFRFGPAGDRTEVMELIRVDGRWGLASF